MKRRTRKNGPQRTARATANNSQSSNTQGSESQARQISEARVKGWLRKAKLKLHPVAAQIPRMSEEQFELFKADIREGSQREPIWVKDKFLVDGLHRLGACIELNKKPRFEEYPNDDLTEFILSANLFRRHLTVDQRAILVAKYLGPKARAEAQERIKAQQFGSRDTRENAAPLKSAEPSGDVPKTLAQIAGVGRDKMRAAIQVTEEQPEAIDSVAKGEKKLAEVGKRKSTKRERKGTTLNGEPSEKAFEPETFEALVLQHFGTFFRRLFRNYIDKKREADVKRCVINDWLSLFHQKQDRTMVAEYVVYEDGTKFKVDDVLRERIGLHLKTDKREKLKPDSSEDWTEASGHAARKGGAV